MKTVLAPIDFSELTASIVTAATAIARAASARLVLLHVVPPAGVISSDFAETPVAAHRTGETEMEAAARLTELQRELRDRGVTAHVVHQTGPVAERIIEQEERLDADYIVMGSHGHGALYGLIVGSTTNGVLKRASCPVVIVPPAIAAGRPAAEAAVTQALSV